VSYRTETSESELYKYCAAKILTVRGTRAHASGCNRELEVLQEISESESMASLPMLEDYFEVHGPEGEHLCLITAVYSTDVSSFSRGAPGGALPVHVVHNIIAHTLDGLAQLQELGIIHSSLSPNFMLNILTTY
jgi:serine/threonine-protein kinase SRPK3